MSKKNSGPTPTTPWYLLVWRDLESGLCHNFRNHASDFADKISYLPDLVAHGSFKRLESITEEAFNAENARTTLAQDYFVPIAKVLAQHSGCTIPSNYYRHRFLYDTWVPRAKWDEHWPQAASDKNVIEEWNIQAGIKDKQWRIVQIELSNDLTSQLVNHVLRYDDALLEERKVVLRALTHEESTSEGKKKIAIEYLRKIVKFLLSSEDVCDEKAKREEQWERRFKNLDIYLDEDYHFLDPDKAPKKTPWKKIASLIVEVCFSYRLEKRTQAGLMCGEGFQSLLLPPVKEKWQSLSKSELWGLENDGTPVSIKNDDVLNFIIEAAKRVGNLPDSQNHPASYRRLVLDDLGVKEDEWDTVWPSSKEERQVFYRSLTPFADKVRLFFQIIGYYKTRNLHALRQSLKTSSEYDHLVLSHYREAYCYSTLNQRSAIAAGEGIWDDAYHKSEFVGFLAATARALHDENSEASGMVEGFREKAYDRIGVNEKLWEYYWPIHVSTV
ncbi:hypothetical protein CC80DRAFT_547486 [Byssothecium circinans]|uniref:Uncharacterized protein n=1 Tax=Byssothecium circinans TaxID=147558 RepID=A0A6A5U162_9PLEO|nr:hypothetical protein CC80DRAFT_547486 [Byssothecium circinans]